MYLAAFDEKKVLAESFEQAIDEFVLVVLEQAKQRHINVDELSELQALLKEERSNEHAASKRRREALLGFDPDEAPLSLIAVLEDLEGKVGGSAVDELAALLPSEVFRCPQCGYRES
jgi:hypothetical protein